MLFTGLQAACTLCAGCHDWRHTCRILIGTTRCQANRAGQPRQSTYDLLQLPRKASKIVCSAVSPAWRWPVVDAAHLIAVALLPVLHGRLHERPPARRGGLPHEAVPREGPRHLSKRRFLSRPACRPMIFRT